MKSTLYKIQCLNPQLGYWRDLFNFTENEYSEAHCTLYKEYNKDNSRQYRLLMVTEEVLDSCFPPGS